MTGDHDTWHWQEPGKAWKGAGIYHVTLVVPSREPLLGTLVIPDDDPEQASVERSELGDMLVDELLHIHEYYPEILILQYTLMPDHLHAIMHVRHTMHKSIRTVVRSFWQGAKKIGRIFSSSIASELNSDIMNEGDYRYIDPIFTEHPFIRPLSRRGQLQSMIRYIQMNPQRLATKRLKPGYFRVQEGIEIAGRIYSGVGNAALLQATSYATVHVRHTMEDAARKGDEQSLRDYMNSCILAARQGAVMVSPFISEHEKAVLEVLLKEERPVIYIADNGFRDYYKPSDGLFDAVADGRLLILSPWPYDPKKRHVTRAECIAMNGMAEEICSLRLLRPN